MWQRLVPEACLAFLGTNKGWPWSSCTSWAASSHCVYKDSCQPAGCFQLTLQVPGIDPAVETVPHQQRLCGFPCCRHRFSEGFLNNSRQSSCYRGHSHTLALLLTQGRKPSSLQLFLWPSNNWSRSSATCWDLMNVSRHAHCPTLCTRDA